MQSYFPVDEYKPDYLSMLGEYHTEISFDEISHQYFVARDAYFQYPSVSFILEQVFGNRFKRVRPEVLERARKKGSEIHDEILQWTIGKGGGVSPEFRIASENIRTDMSNLDDKIACEQRLFCDTPSYAKFCCTIDAFWIGRGRLVDYKTSTKFDYPHVVRQLNLYAYALKKNGYCVNTLVAWHLQGEKLTVVPIEYKGDFYCECILKAYFSGHKFRGDAEMLAFYKDGEVEEKKADDVVYECCKKLKSVDEMIDKLKSTREVLVGKIKSEMENVKTNEYSFGFGMSVKLIPGSERKSIDTAELKEERPDLYDCLMRDFSKTTKVAPHIRVSYNKES